MRLPRPDQQRVQLCIKFDEKKWITPRPNNQVQIGLGRQKLAGQVLYKICACYVCKLSYDNLTRRQLGNLEFDHGINYAKKKYNPVHAANDKDPEVF